MAEVPYYTDENGVTRVKPLCTVTTSAGIVKGAGEIITLSKPQVVKPETTEEVENGGV